MHVHQHRIPMPTRALGRALLVAAAAALSSTLAGAHQIWIEPDGERSARIHFGEFRENLREASPGLIDRFGAMEAHAIAADGSRQRLVPSKQAEGFAMRLPASATSALIAEDRGYPAYDRTEGGTSQRAVYRPAARWVPGWAAQGPVLDLDVVPTGRPGEVQVHFKGKPLPRAKIALVTASGWGREQRTDADGRAAFNLPWSGTYVFEVSHTDATPGQRPGAAGAEERFDVSQHVSTLLVVQAGGLAPLPAMPKAAANPPPAR
jgi:hypothetical protein